MGLSPRGCPHPTATAPCASTRARCRGRQRMHRPSLRQARGSCPDCQTDHSRARASPSPVTQRRAAASALPPPPPPLQPGWGQQPGSPPSGATPPPSTHQVPLLGELGVGGLHENVSLGPALCHLLLQPVHLGQEVMGLPWLLPALLPPVPSREPPAPPHIGIAATASQGPASPGSSRPPRPLCQPRRHGPAPAEQAGQGTELC